jgi:hypothetical protein
MPQGVLKCDQVELNYLTARGDGRLFIAFTNQSKEAVTANVTLNGKLIGGLSGQSKRAKVRRQNSARKPLSIADGAFTVTVQAQGITSVEIGGVEINPTFQPGILERENRASWSPDYLEMPFGNARAMMLPGLNTDNAYIYLQADDAEFSAVTLRYEQNGSWNTVVDDAYPYEFTVPVDGAAAEFKFVLEGLSVDGKTARSEEERFRRAEQ